MWFDDLRKRVEFFRLWIENENEPSEFWISAFAYPTAFLTAVLQRSARRHQVEFLLVGFFVLSTFSFRSPSINCRGISK